MSLHLDSSRLPRWLRLFVPSGQSHVDRSTLFVIGVIAISIALGALQVADVAVSGALRHFHAVHRLPPPGAPDTQVGSDTADGALVTDCSLVPSASVDAINL
jgi:hypothetical protein